MPQPQALATDALGAFAGFVHAGSLVLGAVAITGKRERLVFAALAHALVLDEVVSGIGEVVLAQRVVRVGTTRTLGDDTPAQRSGND